MSSVTQTVFLTKMIREGFEKADVDLWQSLLQQAKTNIGDSHTYVFLLLDMARHNKVNVLEIVKTGRVCSNEKVVNDKFMTALLHAVDVDEEVRVSKSATGVLDLTCEEELSHSGSGSYEETSQPFNDNPTSAEAYEIDGFVVPDHESESAEDSVERKSGLWHINKQKKRLLKRKIDISEQE